MVNPHKANKKAAKTRRLCYLGGGALVLVFGVCLFAFSGNSALQKREEFSDGEIQRMFEGDNLGRIEKFPDDKRREYLERYGKIMGSRGFDRTSGGRINNYLDTLSGEDQAAFLQGLQHGEEYGKERAEKRKKEWIARIEGRMLAFEKKPPEAQEQEIRQEVKRIGDAEEKFLQRVMKNTNNSVRKPDLARISANFRKAPRLRPEDEKLLSSKAQQIKRDFDKRLQEALNKMPPLQMKEGLHSGGVRGITGSDESGFKKSGGGKN